MEHSNGYTIVGCPPDVTRDLPIRLSKSPSIKREPKVSDNNLRILYRNSMPPPAEEPPSASSDSATAGPTTPTLPLTPPHADDGDQEDVIIDTSSDSDTAKLRSILVTPINQQSPPTPDLTPPREPSSILRPFLGAQPSMASTKAESFRTAMEEIHSDHESEASLPISRTARSYKISPTFPHSQVHELHKPSPLTQALSSHSPDGQSTDSMAHQHSPHEIILPPEATINRDDILTERLYEDSPTIPQDIFRDITPSRKVIQPREQDDEIAVDSKTASPRVEIARRGASLRERLRESRNVPRSPSVDKFASIIGWNESVQNHEEQQYSKRWSGISTTSTVEALVIEKPRLQRNIGTLRHVSKNDSLRSTSSPFPASNRTSDRTTSGSPHRLVHKKAKLSNANRYSFGSDVSRSMSLGSIVPSQKHEVIKVAVIPERNSSLQGSLSSSAVHSHSASAASIPSHTRVVSESYSSRKRTGSETVERGRDRYYPPQVPPQIPVRASSLSAPTSRATSRANSISSDHIHVERRKAEKDLRTTLQRMESERLASSMESFSEMNSLSKMSQHPAVHASIDMAASEHTDLSTARAQPINLTQITIKAHDFAPDMETHLGQIVPGSKEWAALRPTSMLETPFSQPSLMSASPEISEAKAINLFPHNNHSVQLIEPFPLQESRAVKEARFRNTDELKMEEISALPQRYVDSPLRNPRRPPQPPLYQSLPPNPYRDGSSQAVMANTGTTGKRFGSIRQRPTIGTSRADSFGKILMRNVSLKHATNRKADQDLDPKLNPFWRPRAFWDDAEHVQGERADFNNHDRGIVQNSLGLPGRRSTLSGPVGLMHRISERRRTRKILAKQSSHTSLQRLRTGRKLYGLSGQGISLRLMGFKGIQDHFTKSKQRREDERREKRREELRKSIGPNVISTGDSRFPITHTNNSTSKTTENMFPN